METMIAAGNVEPQMSDARLDDAGPTEPLPATTDPGVASASARSANGGGPPPLAGPQVIPLSLPCLSKSAAARPPDRERTQDSEAAAAAAAAELAALRAEQALLARRAEEVAERIAALDGPSGAAGPSGSAIYMQGVATTVTLAGTLLMPPTP
jgi:hypothetical protein